MAAAIVLQASLFSTPLKAEPNQSLNTAIWVVCRKAAEWMQREHINSAAVFNCQVFFDNDRTPERNDLGPIHVNVAERMERGLVVVQRPKDPEIRIAREAHKVASATKGAAFADESGRRALCEAEFDSFWGSGSLSPDAFLMGVLRLESETSRNGTLFLLAFRRSDPAAPPQKIAETPARLSVQDAIDAGRSFQTRGLFNGGSIRTEEKTSPVDGESVVLESVVPEVAQDPFAQQPVRLQILYDGIEQAIRRERGEFRVSEPAAGQTIEFAVVRQGDKRPRLALVLKINGENSYGKQRLPDTGCVKWILDPTASRFPIRGFQLDGQDQVQPFRAASEAESLAVQNQFGSDVGTISLTVFGERDGKAPIEASQVAQGEQPLPADLRQVGGIDKDLQAISEGATPARSDAPSTSQSLREICQRGLRGKGAGSLSRGLILNDSTTRVQQIRKVDFTLNPLPLFSVTVRYRDAAR
jgi:hypothetical protein